MSIDIDWSLLPASELAESLIDALNRQLASSQRPSFIGPITITAFDFGSKAPEVEITDIRDVWRAFFQGDTDEEETHLSQAPPTSSLDEEPYDIVTSREARSYLEDEEGLDDASIYSGLVSPRQSITAVGIGLESSTLHFGMGRDYASAIMSPIPGLNNPSLFSQPPIRAPRGSGYPQVAASSVPPRRSSSAPPSPAVRHSSNPVGESPIPSLQLHLRMSHSADITLTISTSLTINYPSRSFMSLPLKLSVTGWIVAADLIIAYARENSRMYISITKDDVIDGSTASVGERLLPSLSIESEIGHADAHVLKNVGKVERFIAEAVRKAIVEELVFPNFQAIAL